MYQTRYTQEEREIALHADLKGFLETYHMDDHIKKGNSLKNKDIPCVVITNRHPNAYDNHAHCSISPIDYLIKYLQYDAFTAIKRLYEFEQSKASEDETVPDDDDIDLSPNHINDQEPEKEFDTNEFGYDSTNTYDKYDENDEFEEDDGLDDDFYNFM